MESSIQESKPPSMPSLSLFFPQWIFESYHRVIQCWRGRQKRQPQITRMMTNRFLMFGKVSSAPNRLAEMQMVLQVHGTLLKAPWNLNNKPNIMERTINKKRCQFIQFNRIKFKRAAQFQSKVRSYECMLWLSRATQGMPENTNAQTLHAKSNTVQNRTIGQFTAHKLKSNHSMLANN